jgi:small subunit ribosomal protein S18
MPSPKSQDRRAGRPQATVAGQARRRSCSFCRDKIDEIDYKSPSSLRRFISDKGKIRSQRVTGVCRRHQRLVAVAIKRAREMALLPYASR